VAANSQHLKRLAAPLQGTALATYFVLLPYVVLTKWHRTQRQNDGTLVRALLVALALFWFAFLFQVVRDVWRLRRGGPAGSGGSAWLAGGLVVSHTDVSGCARVSHASAVFERREFAHGGRVTPRARERAGSNSSPVVVR
jgi:hypothetical protein